MPIAIRASFLIFNQKLMKFSLIGNNEKYFSRMNHGIHIKYNDIFRLSLFASKVYRQELSEKMQ